MKEFVNKGNGPIESWHEETRRSLEMLVREKRERKKEGLMSTKVERIEAAENEKESAKRNLLQLEQTREDERSSNFVLNEEINRLQSAFEDAKEKSALVEFNMAEKIKALRAEVEGKRERERERERS